MQCALDEASAAFHRGEVPVGAVVVESASGRIIASAGNRVEELATPHAHAEMLALAAAHREKNAKYLTDCDLYVTLEPCAMCAQAIAFSRIKRLYFGAFDSKGGGVEHGARIFSQTTCHHHPEYYGGIMETGSSLLLKNFFATKR